jgi:single-stranded DNA-binding protein
MPSVLTVVGALGQDPQQKKVTLKDGLHDLTTLSVCSNEYHHGKDLPVWYTVELWDGQSEGQVRYLKKGSVILVYGSLIAEAGTLSPGKAFSTLKIQSPKLKLLPQKKLLETIDEHKSASSPEHESVDLPSS